MHQKANSEAAKATLYVVATPIGNLRDITLRAMDILASVDVIAAEDTRLTSGLLRHYSLQTKLMPLFEHNERAASQKILALLEQGQSVALVSDAGTPGISDPGALLVAAVHAAGFAVVPLPGPNAAVTALCASGIAAPHFLFYGFLPAKSTARRNAIAGLQALPYTLIFYEAPHRVVEVVEDLAELLGADRQIVVARELTKLFETLHSCTLGEAKAWLCDDANRQRGEFVLLVSGALEMETQALSIEYLKLLTTLLDELPLAQAVKLATGITGQNKKLLYAKALELKAITEA